MSDLVYDACSSMSREQLVLFLTVRSLPTDGEDKELASRLANYDFRTYTFPCNDDLHNVAFDLHSLDIESRNEAKEDTIGPVGSLTAQDELLDEHLPPSPPLRQFPNLPTEILADIVDHLGDWELARAVGLPTSLPRPP